MITPYKNIMSTMQEIKSKMLGCLYGQAIGDALGLGTEFMNKEEVPKAYPDGFNRYEDIVQDAHRRRWPIGAWTDDTDMMLCIMTAFEDRHFNIKRVAQNFKDWFEGTPLGIGGHTYKVLCMTDYVEQPEACSNLWWELSRKKSAANGALMRTSVVGLVHDNVEDQTIKICKLTHCDPRCIGSCVIATAIIYNLVWNNRELTFEEIKAIGNRFDERIVEWVELAYNSNDISMLQLDESGSIGYTLRTLSAALWCYFHTASFEEGLLAVVNEGGDADTNAAISCAILGAKYGYDSIPHYYIGNLYNESQYRKMVNHFIDLAIQ